MTQRLFTEMGGIGGKLILAIAAAVMVTMVPQKARADHGEAAAAVLIGAAILYAAHESEKSRRDDRAHHRHIHSRHCNHRGNARYRAHHPQRHGAHQRWSYDRGRRDGFRDHQVSYGRDYYSDRRSGYHGKHHKNHKHQHRDRRD